MINFKFSDQQVNWKRALVQEVKKSINAKVAINETVLIVRVRNKHFEAMATQDGIIAKLLVKKGDVISDDQELFTIDKPKNIASSLTINQAKSKVILATPLARNLARKKQIDLSLVKGSGYNGRILVKDLENYEPINQQHLIDQKQIKFAANKVTKLPLTGVRKAIAKAMSNSWTNVAYSNLVTEVDVSKLYEQRQNVLTKTDFVERLGIKLSFLPFIIKATTLAIVKFPFINAKYDHENNQLIYESEQNIGFAVDAPQGLLVPVIKNAQTKSILEIGREISELAIKVRNKKIALSEMKGGTFSITNYGSVGSSWGVPVINYPELAIMGVGAIANKLKINQMGNIINAKVMHLTVAFDHRFIDGADAGRFTQEVKKILENPILLMEEFNV